jgi:hypothetical protein
LAGIQRFIDMVCQVSLDARQRHSGMTWASTKLYLDKT